MSDVEQLTKSVCNVKLSEEERRVEWSQNQATNRFVRKLCWLLEDDVANFRVNHAEHEELLSRLEELILGMNKSQVLKQGHIVHALCLYKRAPKKQIWTNPTIDRIYTIFLLSLIITCKDTLDEYFRTYVWTPFCRYSVHEINTMERRFLRICDYQVMVKPVEYDQQVAVFA